MAIEVHAHPEGPHPGTAPWPTRKYDKYDAVNPPPGSKPRFHAGNDRDLKFEIRGVMGNGEATLKLERNDPAGSVEIVNIKVSFTKLMGDVSPLTITLLADDGPPAGQDQDPRWQFSHLGTGPDGLNGDFTATVTVSVTGIAPDTQPYYYVTKKD